ncbi:MAG: hypothetical protein N2322_02215 [Terrimicrobiaceae bacterium]|nr:hypothetical protein [Terrimicrobiaceae bacterium]
MPDSTLAAARAKPRQKLLAWFRRHGRELPWRRRPEPWAVVVSEFLLQQTTVAAVLPRFEEWMRRFPTPAHMARARESEVLAMWQGLGYYRRAVNLRRAAQAMVLEHGGKVPRDAAVLERLPGFGPYTAAAVAAFAFDKPVEVLDANILRVALRLGNVREPAASAAGRRAAARIVRSLLPKRRGGRAVISALMDLGALVCRPRAPRCPHCPLREICRTPEPEALPLKPPRPKPVRLRDRRAWIAGGGRVALIPSPGPWWRGLWLLPPAAEAVREPALLARRFAVTRHRVEMEVFADERPPPEARWFRLSRLPPMPAPHLEAVHLLAALAPPMKKSGAARRGLIQRTG